MNEKGNIMTEMKRIDEIELVSGDGRILRVYKLHPNAKELVAEALTKCPKIKTGVSKFADKFATFFNAAYSFFTSYSISCIDCNAA